MICPKCKCIDSRVVTSKACNQEYILTQKKRECLNCSEIFITSSIIAEDLQNAFSVADKLLVDKMI